MKFSLGDALVTGFVAAASALLLVAFLNDLNSVLGRGNERALGTVVFKKQTATRKPSRSEMWERLRNLSPVYQADTIRTADGSEAEILFDQGMRVSLMANSMVRVDLKGDTAQVDFREGSISMKGGSSSSLVLGSTGQKVNLSPDAQLVIHRQADTVRIELSQGTAVVQDSRGVDHAVSPTAALEVDTQSGGATAVPVRLIPLRPESGDKVLSLSDTEVAITFAYEVASEENVGGGIQVSPSPEFLSIAATIDGQRAGSGSDGPLFSAVASLPAGTWYWRISAPDGSLSSVRQFFIDRDAPPRLVGPADASQVFFREVFPELRFSWAPSDKVGSWDLELSQGTPDFTSPFRRISTSLNALTLDGLAPGTWYWRVVPHYSLPLAGAAPVPAVRSFSVTRRPAMQSLTLDVPVEGTRVKLQDLKTSGLAFSWTPADEAVSYELTAYRDSAAGVPGKRFISPLSRLVLSPQDLAPLAAEGPIYWTLHWVDREGNRSPDGPPRQIRVVNDAVALTARFPPDGYRIYDQYLTNTLFSWNATPPVAVRFQVSRSPSFSDLVEDAPADAESRLGRPWGSGTFYWRLAVDNANDDPLVRTPGRRIDIVGPLPPVHLSLSEGTRLLVAPYEDGVPVSWDAPVGADAFQLSVYGPGHERASDPRPLYQSTIEHRRGQRQDTVQLPVGNGDGEYLVRIQALGRDSPQSTSVVGLFGDSRLTVVHLRPIALTAPENGVTVDGLNAKHQGVAFSWDAPSPAPSYQVVVRRVSDGASVLDQQSDAPPVKMSLAPGEYQWTVHSVLEGYDLTPREPSRLVVAPIPLLPAAVDLRPVDQTVFGPAQLRSLESLEFTWTPVPGAQEYEFRLYAAPGPNATAPASPPLLRSPVVGPPRLVLADLALLHRGAFRWEVEALTRSADGQVEQSGVVARSRFIIDLPALEPPQLSSERTYYVH